MNSHSTNKLSSARLLEETDAYVEEFTASVSFDQRMYQQDITGSIAHATMLSRVGVLTEEESTTIIDGLTQINDEIRRGEFNWSVKQEDVHMNLEARLIAIVGEVGKKLHTGRSRNDQVATDIRLYLRDESEMIKAQLLRFQKGLAELALKHHDVIMPGFTHLQVAQPITFGHHLMAWYEMLHRDSARLDDCLERVNIMPLGSAALAGTTYPIDRNLTAELLGFSAPNKNSLDGVSDRDFIIEFNAFASITMMHLSRMAEELIIWTSAQFDFIHLPDRFTTGSSIMPQKKNPDVPELVRGKTGRVFGHLLSTLTLMKGQPLAYNKDNQEDKEPLFDVIDTLKNSLRAFADMVPSVEPKTENMRRAAMQGFATATDLADYLVKKGMPFRDAHDIVGQAVAFGVKQNVDLSELSLETLHDFSSLISEDVYEVLTLEGSIAARNHIGGTAPAQVKARAKEALESL